MSASLPDAMIFDVDGTLFKTESVLDEAYEQSFQEVKNQGLYTGPVPPVQQFHACLGMLLDDIWNKILPEASKAARDFLNERLVVLQVENLKRGKGQLFPHVKETLEILHTKGIRLFVASNGLEDYVKGVVKYTGLDSVIEKSYSAGEYETPSKVDLVRLILEEQKLQNPWMVGDRYSDVEAGVKNGLYVVGCGYSSFKDHHEIEDANVIISNFDEILQLL